jgi:hypothetical protein
MNSNYQIPPPPNPNRQAELILKNLGLTFIKPKFFKVDSDTMAIEQEAADPVDTDIYVNGDNAKDSKSKFGLPVFDAIRFEEVRYTSNDGRNLTVPTFDIGTVLCEVNQPRNIVKTAIAGRDGTVKEYIGKGDYEVNIRGVLVSLYQNVPPKDALTNLLGFCDAPVEFNVTSSFLAYFGIYTMVCDDYAFKQIEGSRNMIGFQMRCLSDYPYEIKGNDL